MQVCNIEAGPVNGGLGGCDDGCVYKPAFTATDATLGPFTNQGIYNAHCEAGAIMSFDGRSIQAGPFVQTVATPEIWFADKCESENFLMLLGQEVHLAGDFLGTLEILIPDDVCLVGQYDDINVITFYRSDGTRQEWTYGDVCDSITGGIVG